MRKLFFLIVFLFFILPANADIVQTFKDYSVGDVVTDVNLDGNFNNIRNELNGGLTNDNADVAAGFRFIQVVNSLPAAGNQGRIVFLTADNLLYQDTGSQWIATPVYASTAAEGDLLFFNATNNIWTLLNRSTATSRYLSNEGTNNRPAWAQIDVTDGVKNKLTVVNGGTGQSTFTIGSLLIGASATAISNTGVLSDGFVVVGDGATSPVTVQAFTSSSGTLRHEVGGVEADISAVIKGDLLVGTGTGAIGLKNVGANGLILEADSTAAGGIKYGKKKYLGSWASGTFNSSTQVTEDGFLIATAAGNVGCADDEAFTLKTDSANPPTTIRAQVDCNDDGTPVFIFSPIKDNDYYLIEDLNNGFGSETVYFIPL